MPLEQFILAFGGLVLAVLVAALIGGQIGRLVRRRLDTRASASTVGRLGSPLGPSSPAVTTTSAAAVGRLGPPLAGPVSAAQPSGLVAPAVPVTLIAPAQPAGPQDQVAAGPFPGVVGSRLFANTPPPVISIPTSSMSPAARDRAALGVAPPPVPIGARAAAPDAAPAAWAWPPRVSRRPSPWWRSPPPGR